jgi:predicted DsbA family dithiol-disulfide isomerase
VERVRITHFSDLLCVWAYVSQIRVDQLETDFPGRIELDYRYLHVFGDVAGKMEAAWSGRGGQAAYAEHVRGIVDGFDHVDVHPRVWLDNTPTSSMPAHVVLCAVRLIEQAGAVEVGTASRTAWRMREAFFGAGEDISDRDVLLDAARRCGVESGQATAMLDDGRAHAALAADLELAHDQVIRASPTLVFNEGRQRLTGNVGYRIIEANVRELLDHPAEQQSWC